MKFFSEKREEVSQGFEFLGAERLVESDLKIFKYREVDFSGSMEARFARYSSLASGVVKSSDFARLDILTTGIEAFAMDSSRYTPVENNDPINPYHVDFAGSYRDVGYISFYYPSTLQAGFSPREDNTGFIDSGVLAKKTKLYLAKALREGVGDFTADEQTILRRWGLISGKSLKDLVRAVSGNQEFEGVRADLQDYVSRDPGAIWPNSKGPQDFLVYNSLYTSIVGLPDGSVLKTGLLNYLDAFASQIDWSKNQGLLTIVSNRNKVAHRRMGVHTDRIMDTSRQRQPVGYATRELVEYLVGKTRE